MEALGAEDDTEAQGSCDIVVEDLPPPDHMDTHQVSKSNFKYDVQAAAQPEKYKGDPKKDLQEEFGLLDDEQRLEMTHNQDMNSMFDE